MNHQSRYRSASYTSVCDEQFGHADARHSLVAKCRRGHGGCCRQRRREERDQLSRPAFRRQWPSGPPMRMIGFRFSRTCPRGQLSMAPGGLGAIGNVVPAWRRQCRIFFPRSPESRRRSTISTIAIGARRWPLRMWPAPLLRSVPSVLMRPSTDCRGIANHRKVGPIFCYSRMADGPSHQRRPRPAGARLCEPRLERRRQERPRVARYQWEYRGVADERHPDLVAGGNSDRPRLLGRSSASATLTATASPICCGATRAATTRSGS